MKMILLIAAVLMTAAGVYGILDYRVKDRDKGLRELYKEEKRSPAAAAVKEAPAKKPEAVPPKTELVRETRKEARPVEKKIVRKKKKRISYKEFSRARPDKVEIPDEKELR